MADLNLQLHGYATQGFLYSPDNNWNTTFSNSGSAAWSEAVLNVTLNPEPKLSIGIQARYFLLGHYGNEIQLDWAQANYKFNRFVAVKVGDVKTPSGLWNDVQDIDPAYLWTLLPQSVYPLSSRKSLLSHYGGVLYGAVALGGDSLGKLEYRAYGGERVLSNDDSSLDRPKDLGIILGDGEKGHLLGGTLLWHTPLAGLVLGATEQAENVGGSAQFGASSGTFGGQNFYQPFFFGKYEHQKLMVAAEYSRLATRPLLVLPGGPTIVVPLDQRASYLMTSYKINDKLSAGAYYSNSIDRTAAYTTARYQKDLALSARYDLNSFAYLKAEQHLMRGTQIGLDAEDNPALQPNTRLTLFKFGVSF